MQYKVPKVQEYVGDEGAVSKVIATLSLVREDGSTSEHGYELSQDELAAYVDDRESLEATMVNYAAQVVRALGSGGEEWSGTVQESAPAITLSPSDVEAKLVEEEPVIE